MDERMSTRAYIFTLGKIPISWSSKKQNVMSRSSCESEYRAPAKATCETVWLCRLIHELGLGNRKPTIVWCNNQSSINIAKNPMFHNRTKHFEIDLHFTRQKIEDNTIKVEFTHTNNNQQIFLPRH